MAGEWQLMTLRTANVTLIDCDHRTPPAANDGYPYVAIPQMQGGRIELGGARRISQEHYLEWTRKAKPSTNDVVLSRRCNPGETAVAPPGAEFALGQNLVLLRADGTKVYPPFLRWLARGPEWWEQISKFNNVGAVFDSLRCADVPKFEMRIPPLPEQRAIAHILGTLDDKIELNRRMSETLEAMARALFKSWFVDFDPVRAKAEGRDPGLPKPLADLFPARLVDSELGEIPEGWEVAPLPEVVNVNPKRALPKGVAAPYLDMANMPTHGHSADEVVDRAFGSGMRFINGDTLVARITPCLENGKTAFVDFLEDDKVGWGSTEYIVLRPKAPLPEEYAYCLARSPEFREFAIQSMTGTSGRQRVPAESLAHFQVAVPPRTIAEAFDRAVKPRLARASAAVRESRTLSALRNALLPKLMSGELQVEGVGELLKEATQ